MRMTKAEIAENAKFAARGIREATDNKIDDSGAKIIEDFTTFMLSAWSDGIPYDANWLLENAIIIFRAGETNAPNEVAYALATLIKQFPSFEKSCEACLEEIPVVKAD